MKYVNLFLNSAGILLLITSGAKFISSFGHSAILQTGDPLTGLRFQNVFFIVAIVELVVALFCFFSARTFLAAGLTAWLGTCFLIYRVCLGLSGYHRPCICLGNFTDALHISPQTTDTAMKIILAYILLGSYASMFWLWRRRKAPSYPAKSGVNLV
jgi:hypothetical protein